jgi:hypothetical protein
MKMNNYTIETDAGDLFKRITYSNKYDFQFDF